MSFHDIKPGDRVAVNYGGWGRSKIYRTKTVDRVTATQIILGEQRFRKTDGQLVGSDNFARPVRLEVLDDEMAKRITKYKILENLVDAVDNVQRPTTLSADEYVEKVKDLLALAERYAELEREGVE